MQKNDVVSISYEAKLKEGGQKIIETKDSPVVIGAGYIIKGVAEALEGMNVGDKKEIEVTPDKGFGERSMSNIKIIPESEFKKHGQKPYPGMFITADNLRGRVMSVSSGRVRVDFNHPLAGKEVKYKININKKIENDNEKIKAMSKFLFKKEFKFEIKDKKLIMHVDTPLVKFVEMFKN